MIDLRAISFPCKLNRFDFINDIIISNIAFFQPFFTFLEGKYIENYLRYQIEIFYVYQEHYIP